MNRQAWRSLPTRATWKSHAPEFAKRKNGWRGRSVLLLVEMDRLLEGDRKLRLLQDLKKAGRREWRMEHERELAAFADEAFVGRVSRGTIGKRTGA